MILNLVTVAIFAVNLWLRTKGTPDVTLPAVVLSAIGIILLLISGWLVVS